VLDPEALRKRGAKVERYYLDVAGGLRRQLGRQVEDPDRASG